MCGWSLLEKCIAWRSACHSVCGRRIDFPSPPDDFIIIIVGGALHAAINLSPTHHSASIFSSYSSIHIFRWMAASLKKLEFYRNLNYSAHSRAFFSFERRCVTSPDEMIYSHGLVVGGGSLAVPRGLFRSLPPGLLRGTVNWVTRE